MPQSPLFNYTSLGLGIESGLGIAAAPTLWLSAQDVAFTGTNAPLERTSARGNIGREYPAVGVFGGGGSLTIETDPDMLGALLALSMGGEAIVANTANPSAVTLTGVTLAAATLASNAPQWWTPSSMTNIVTGLSLSVDTGGNAETTSVQATSNTQVYSVLKNAHNLGVQVSAAPVVLGYDHTYTLAIPRKTATFQWNRRTDCIQYTGNKVATLDFTAASTALLTARLTTTYVNEQNTTANTPAYSTLEPFRFNDAGNSVSIAGNVADAGVVGFAIMVNTGLMGSEHTFGAGRQISSIPEGQTRISGSLTLQFETQTAQQRFWGSPGATGPQTTIQPVSLSFTWQGRNYINTAVRYRLVMSVGQAFITTAPIPGRTGGILQQTVNFEGFESGNQLNDDAKFVLTNTSAVPT